jgi:Fur family ferric uptake transcriptional regulator
LISAKYDLTQEDVLNNNDELKKAGLKVTLPRLKILQLLEDTKEHHLSAEDIYRKLLDMGEEMSLATIYRVLTQFQEAGLVVRRHFEGDLSVFELNHGEHHDHLVCIKCGSVKEFIDPEIDMRQEEIAKQAGYVMTDHSLNIYGICVKCQQKNQEIL